MELDVILSTGSAADRRLGPSSGGDFARTGSVCVRLRDATGGRFMTDSLSSSSKSSTWRDLDNRVELLPSESMINSLISSSY